MADDAKAHCGGQRVTGRSANRGHRRGCFSNNRGKLYKRKAVDDVMKHCEDSLNQHSANKVTEVNRSRGKLKQGMAVESVELLLNESVCT